MMDTREAIFLKDDEELGVPKSEYGEFTQGVYRRHVDRYQHAAKVCYGKTIDIACGSGYGSQLLKYETYVGIDASLGTIKYAKNNYSGPGITFLCEEAIGALRSVHSFTADSVACIETLEHLPKKNQPLLLDEIRRILDTSGVLFLTSPVTDAQGIQSGNPYHLYEPRLDEMMDMLYSRFGIVECNLDSIYTTAKVEQVMGEFTCYP